MEVGKQLAKAIFANLGFDFADIPVGKERTADLRVTDIEGTIYHVEVKDKFEDDEQAEERISKLTHGDAYEQHDPLSRDNRIAGVLRGARDQLDRTTKQIGTFQLIWFHATGIDDDLKRSQAFATFYGQVDLVAIKPLQDEIARCLYFDYNAGYQMPTIDAMILTDSRSFQLCLNEFATRIDAFRATTLYRKFAEVQAVFDPVALVNAGRFIACRSPHSRKDENASLAALKQQTGVLYSTLRPTRHACSVAVKAPPPTM